jgi:hypothetical protein
VTEVPGHVIDPNGDARRALQEAVAEHGPEALSNAVIMYNVCRDHLIGLPGESILIGSAARSDVPALLRSLIPRLGNYGAIQAAAATLAEEHELDVAACLWVVREFARALGHIAPGPATGGSGSFLGPGPRPGSGPAPRPVPGPIPVQAADSEELTAQVAVFPSAPAKPASGPAAPPASGPAEPPASGVAGEGAESEAAVSAGAGSGSEGSGSTVIVSALAEGASDEGGVTPSGAPEDGGAGGEGSPSGTAEGSRAEGSGVGESGASAGEAAVSGAAASEAEAIGAAASGAAVSGRAVSESFASSGPGSSGPGNGGPGNGGPGNGSPGGGASGGSTPGGGSPGGSTPGPSYPAESGPGGGGAWGGPPPGGGVPWGGPGGGGAGSPGGPGLPPRGPGGPGVPPPGGPQGPPGRQPERSRVFSRNTLGVAAAIALVAGYLGVAAVAHLSPFPAKTVAATSSQSPGTGTSAGTSTSASPNGSPDASPDASPTSDYQILLAKIPSAIRGQDNCRNAGTGFGATAVSQCSGLHGPAAGTVLVYYLYPSPAALTTGFSSLLKKANFRTSRGCTTNDKFIDFLVDCESGFISTTPNVTGTIAEYTNTSNQPIIVSSASHQNVMVVMAGTNDGDLLAYWKQLTWIVS